MLTVFVNPERCIGCLQCEFACAVAHSASEDPATAYREQPPPRKRIHVQAGPLPNTSFPNKCRHCEPAPCQQVCPTGAIHRDAAYDVVLIDTARCIGCAMCAIVCPFDVITYHPVASGAGVSHAAAADGHAVALKCDGCIDRLQVGRRPACVEACKDGALRFGELNELVAEGRRRETAVILTATTDEQPTPAVPWSIGAWRALGAAPGQPGGAR
jgi:carbon-monoxide dehydrogenase iron sulfur subunit